MTKPNTTEILAVVLCWNNRDIIKPCIDSLLAQKEAVEILVIDNGSEDGSYDFLESTYKQRIKLFKNAKNLGFSGGANIGLKLARDRGFKYVALLNSDAVADVDWLTQLAKTLKERDNAGIATSKILKIDGKEIDTTGEQLFYWGLSSPRGRGEVDTGQYDTQQRMFGGSGGASLYSMKMIDEVGMFDEDFFAYYEDADLSFRANSMGWEVVYNPKAVVRHEIGASSSKVSGMAFKMSIKNQPMLLIKNVPLRYLPGVTLRFVFLWLGNLLSGLKSGNSRQALTGFLRLVVLLPKKLCQRAQLQHLRRRKGIKAKDLRTLMTPGLPVQVLQYSTIRFAKKIFFWDKG